MSDVVSAAVLAVGGVLAKDPPTGEASKSGPWGLAIILLLCLASYFLFKSMSRHLRKVREQFPPDRSGARRPGGLAGRFTPPTAPSAPPVPSAEPPGEPQSEQRPEAPGKGPRST